MEEIDRIKAIVKAAFYPLGAILGISPICEIGRWFAVAVHNTVSAEIKNYGSNDKSMCRAIHFLPFTSFTI